MNNYDFYDIVLSNIGLFIWILLFSFVLHYFLFKRQVNSILDPYFLAVISSVFCLTVVFLLYFTAYITLYVFMSYILTQCAFFAGLYTFRRKKVRLHREPYREIIPQDRIDKSLIAFYFFSIVYLGSQCAIYALKGIPLFMESRLETFAGGGGAGVLSRISDVSSIFCLYAFFCVIKLDRFAWSEMPKYIVMFLIFITFLLSGSKSAFLVIFIVLYCYILFNKIKGGNYLVYLKMLRKNIKLILPLSILLVGFIIFVQARNEDEGINPILGLALRFLHSGDVYWYAYPNDIYLKIRSDEWFAALFNDTLGLFRIKNWNQLPEAIGITLKNIHHPSDILQGPNARHNIFGLIYYGYYGSIFFSYLIGLCLGFIRNELPYYLKPGMLSGFLFTYLMYRGASIDSDPMLTITYFDNLFFIFPFLYFAYLMVIEFFKIDPNKK
jgi:oligosaccharide repeat unit polymerase